VFWGSLSQAVVTSKPVSLFFISQENQMFFLKHFISVFALHRPQTEKKPFNINDVSQL